VLFSCINSLTNDGFLLASGSLCSFGVHREFDSLSANGFIYYKDLLFWPGFLVRPDSLMALALIEATARYRPIGFLCLKDPLIALGFEA
jgi:hypothetical protein